MKSQFKFGELRKSEFMEETMMDKKTQKIGVICSIVQIILSIICLIYSAINPVFSRVCGEFNNKI